VADTGPLLAAAVERDRAHELAAAAVVTLGRDLVVPDSVVFETEQFLRHRHGGVWARRFVDDMLRGEHTTAFLSPGLLKRAAEIDAIYADLDLGLVDTSVMAYAERHELPILTFDFRDFRATESAHGPWRLVISEEQLRRALG
jgi:predicted nucleic acid-binding protein